MLIFCTEVDLDLYKAGHVGQGQTVTEHVLTLLFGSNYLALKSKVRVKGKGWGHGQRSGSISGA